MSKQIAIGVLSVIACSPAQGRAQVAGAQLVGTVHDPSQAVLPKASVRLSNVDTGVAHATQSDDAGIYAFHNIPAGRYVLEAACQGFKRYRLEAIVLQVAQRARIDLVLQVGTISETVSVTGSAPLVDTETPMIGGVIPERAIVQLPLNGRNFMQLSTLTAGVNEGNSVSASPARNSRGVAATAGGIPSTANTYTLDGALNKEYLGGAYNVQPPVDAIQEFRVQVGQFTSEFGLSGGAVVNVVTKSGTNDLHGSAWEFHRNDNLNAKNFFASGKPPLIVNQFGATVGGPVVKNRTFFFGAFEGLRDRRAQTFTTLVPTADQRAGNLASLGKTLTDPTTGQPFAGGLIPANRIAAASKIMLDFAVPQPNNADPVRNFVNSSSGRTDYENYMARADHRISDNHQLFGRVNVWNTILFTPATFAVGRTTTDRKFANVALGLTSTLGARLQNEVRLSYNRSLSFFNAADLQGIGIADRMGLKFPEARTEKPGGGFPGMSFARTSLIGSLSAGAPQKEFPTTYSAAENLIWNRGRHFLKFGGEIQRTLHAVLLPATTSYTFGGRYTGDGFADFLLGIPETIGVNTGQELQSNWRQNMFGVYVLDDWKFSPRLTLNLGLRYDLQQAPLERNGYPAFWDPTLRGGIGGLLFPKQNTIAEPFFTQVRPDLPFGFLDRDRVWKSDPNNFAPRVGFALRPFATTRTVVRGGFGISYMYQDSLNYLRDSANAPPFRQRGSITSSPTVPQLKYNSVADDPAGPIRSLTFGTIPAIEDRFANAYIQQWSLSIGQELGRDLVIELQYMGSTAVHTLTFFDEQYAKDGPAAGAIQQRAPFPKWGSLNAYHNSGTVSYNGGLFTLEKRFSHGLAFKAAYTWSKALASEASWGRAGASAFIQNRFNRKGEVGRTSDDLAHRFVGYWVWDLPFGPGKALAAGTSGAIARVIGGWQTSGVFVARSGYPVFMSVGRSNCNSSLGNFCYPNRISDNWLLGGNGVDSPRWNRAAFSVPVFAYGNLGPNQISQNGAWNLDLGVSKTTVITERIQVEFRFELFNAFNHPNFPSLTASPENANFGRAFTADPSRELQFGLKLRW